MSELFSNHSYLSQVLKHKKLPIYITEEFSFYRCVNVEDWVYGKTISELHAGNLRSNDNNGRYSRLFPNERISYWADSPSTALCEIKKHGGNKNYLTFWAYDDASSTFPTLDNSEPLVIIDGRDLNFKEILLKIEENKKLTKEEIELIELIKVERPDCLAYKSVAAKSGVNFLFFEKGFKKLSLRQVKLYWGEKQSKNTARVTCADTCDYTPYVKGYGMCFEPIARKKFNNEYKCSEEYQIRFANYKKALARICR